MHTDLFMAYLEVYNYEIIGGSKALDNTYLSGTSIVIHYVLQYLTFTQKLMIKDNKQLLNYIVASSQSDTH